MKGQPEILEGLNGALTVELTAINQYFCQSKMCADWGFLDLAKKHHEESIGEMKHAEKLIERILFLEGVPEIARYDVIRVGTDVKEQFENDLQLEMKGVAHYNSLIELGVRLGDNGTRELAAPILVESRRARRLAGDPAPPDRQGRIAELPGGADGRARRLTAGVEVALQHGGGTPCSRRRRRWRAGGRAACGPRAATAFPAGRAP